MQGAGRAVRRQSFCDCARLPPDSPAPWSERGERMNEVERAFIAAGKSLSLVWLTEPSGRYRIVEPYMVFVSTKGKRLFHLYQIGGYSSGGVLRGWKNPEIAHFASAEVLDQRFAPRADYNPFNEEMFPDVVFAAPTRDGRVRVPGEG